jgi:hypothetical protein
MWMYEWGIEMKMRARVMSQTLCACVHKNPRSNTCESMKWNDDVCKLYVVWWKNVFSMGANYRILKCMLVYLFVVCNV